MEVFILKKPAELGIRYRMLDKEAGYWLLGAGLMEDGGWKMDTGGWMMDEEAGISTQIIG